MTFQAYQPVTLWERLRTQRLHLAVCAAVGAWALPTFLRASPGWWAPAIAFTLMLGLYQINRLTDQVEDRLNAPQEYFRLLGARRAVTALAVLSLLAAWGLAAAHGWLALAVVAAVSTGVLFGIPLGGGRRIKDRLLLKYLLPGGAWACVTVLLGLEPQRAALTMSVLFVFLYVAGVVMITEALADLRDMLGDRARKTGTLPLTIGPLRTIRAAQAFSLLLALAAIVMLIAGRLPATGWLLVYHGLALAVYARAFGRSGYLRDSHTLTMVNAAHLAIIGLASMLFR